jgi:hypothetical protein
MPPTGEGLAQDRPNVLKLAIGPAADHDVGGGIQGCKVALEGDVAGLHCNAGAQALKCAPASVMAETAAKNTSSACRNMITLELAVLHWFMPFVFKVSLNKQYA